MLLDFVSFGTSEEGLVSPYRPQLPREQKESLVGWQRLVGGCQRESTGHLLCCLWVLQHSSLLHMLALPTASLLPRSGLILMVPARPAPSA